MDLYISFKFGTPIRHLVAYLSLKFGDVQANSKGVMNDNITKKRSKSLVIPIAKTTDHMAKFFLETIL